MRTILVTGGCGFIGSHTCLVLLEKGYRIIIVDSLINSSEEIINAIKSNVKVPSFTEDNLIFRRGDIRDKLFLENVFKEERRRNMPINLVIHFAALKAVNESVQNPIEYWNNNVLGTINLIEVMSKNDCFKFVFSSSATIYKPMLNKQICEDSEIGPINPYGNTKLAIEKFLSDLFRSNSNKWKIVSLRYFNPVGAHNSGNLGENPKGIPNNLFPILLKVALKKQDYLRVFGNDWPTKDGTCVRDYIHVMDLAEAHVSALNYLNETKPNIIGINIGTGTGQSILEIIETFKKVNNCDLPFKFIDRRPGDAPYVVANNSLALKTIKWIPSRNLEDMCRDSWNYAKKQNTIMHKI